MGKQRIRIPNKMTGLLPHAVGKAVNLFRFQSAVLHPAHNVPPGGCANVDSKIAFHTLYPVIIFRIPRKKWPLAISSMPGSTPPFMPPEIIMLRIGAPAEEVICIRKFGFS